MAKLLIPLIFIKIYIRLRDTSLFLITRFAAEKLRSPACRVEFSCGLKKAEGCRSALNESADDLRNLCVLAVAWGANVPDRNLHRVRREEICWLTDSLPKRAGLDLMRLMRSNVTTCCRRIELL